MPKFMDHLDEHERSAGFGLIRTVYMVLGAAGSAAVGLMADVFGWGIAVLGLAALLVGMLAVLVRLATRAEPERRVSAAR
jgi:hypothetical protein